MAAKIKFRMEEYCVSDAIESGTSELTELRDELQDWYDNLPESFQNGEKGDTLQTAIDALSHAENFTASDALESSDGSDETDGCVGGLRFSVSLIDKKKMPRWARRDNAVSKIQSAIQAMQDAIDETDGQDDDPYAETRDQISSDIDELQNICDEAEGAEFPGMYG